MGRTSSKSLSIHYFGDLPLGPGLGPHHYWPFHRPTASKISIFGQTDEFRPFLHLRSLGLLALPDTRRTDVESGNLTNHNPERELFLLPPEKTLSGRNQVTLRLDHDPSFSSVRSSTTDHFPTQLSTFDDYLLHRLVKPSIRISTCSTKTLYPDIRFSMNWPLPFLVQLSCWTRRT